MGYFINKLRKGSIYDLEGELLSFQTKENGLYWFKVVERDIFSLDGYKVKEEELCYTAKEINFIKLVEHIQGEKNDTD